MEFWDAIGVAIVTAFWILADIFLLLNPPIADGIASDLSVPPLALEFGVLVAGSLISWAAHKSAE